MSSNLINNEYMYEERRDFPGGSAVKNPPAMWEMQQAWDRSLGQEDPLEESRAAHYSILIWRIWWTEEPIGLWPTGLQRVGHN